MLKDFQNLGVDLIEYFSEISSWKELTFIEKDNIELRKLENVVDVAKHSITFKINNNHCIVPSQYLLYAILVKEFAIALKDHLDIFNAYTDDKSDETVGKEVKSSTYDLSAQNLDPWSKDLAVRQIVDSNLNFNAKSIINYNNSRYTVRGANDFFSSVILKIINVPDSSSSQLGNIIYNLSCNRELYSYLENRFLSKLPFLIKEKKANRFAYKVISYLFVYDDLSKLSNCIQGNIDSNNKTIKSEVHSLSSVFKASKTKLTANDLTSGEKLRFFEHPIYLNKDDEYYYFSTEWTSGTNSRLDIDSLTSILNINYPEFAVIKEEENFILKSSDSPQAKIIIKQIDFDLTELLKSILSSGLIYDSKLTSRFCASLLTKPFLILTGLSGSGKTKLTEAFSKWISEDNQQICMVSVGADWTNREPLLGYPNALAKGEYVRPDCAALDLILRAAKDQKRPYFLILDEMNMSHVERYFADFLSAMESADRTIKLHPDSEEWKGCDVPSSVELPDNLFIIGTVNIDETTYMFSPKVLDRANVIEFRVTEEEMKDYLESPKELDMDALSGVGASMGESFVAKAKERGLKDEKLKDDLMPFFVYLEKAGAEFGYRTASEMSRFVKICTDLADGEMTRDEVIDAAIMQKLLPKLHGSRKKLVSILEELIKLCVNDDGPKYALSHEKLNRMLKRVQENGFTSYAEA